jgi:hypothetical protein
MRTSYIAFTQSRPIAPIIIAIFLLSFATAVLADLVVGALSTGISDHVTYTNLTLSKPDSVSSEDLMLASIVVNGGSAVGIMPPSGWTLIQRTNNDVNVTLDTYWKIAGASEPGTYSWLMDARYMNSRAGTTSRRFVGRTIHATPGSGRHFFIASIKLPSLSTDAYDQRESRSK